MTGWGQDGPLAQAAGHDINYIAIAGVLHGIGEAGRAPVPPLNYVGDFGGGAMFLAFGMLAALLHARATGEGQVVDAAMTDGAAYLASMTWAFRGDGMWRDARGANILDGGAHFYGCYACADGEWLAVGAIEPQFQRAFLEVLGLADDPGFAQALDARQWPACKARVGGVIATRTRDEWVGAFVGLDACVSPVLTMGEALAHPHNVARGTFIEVDGRMTPAPAPRFSATPADAPRVPAEIGADTARVLAELGFGEGDNSPRE
jgi:alpha-methylacyl-CoA racemase